MVMLFHSQAVFALAFSSWKYLHYSWNNSPYSTLTRVIKSYIYVQYMCVIPQKKLNGPTKHLNGTIIGQLTFSNTHVL